MDSQQSNTIKIAFGENKKVIKLRRDLGLSADVVEKVSLLTGTRKKGDTGGELETLSKSLITKGFGSGGVWTDDRHLAKMAFMLTEADKIIAARNPAAPSTSGDTADPKVKAVGSKSVAKRTSTITVNLATTSASAMPRSKLAKKRKRSGSSNEEAVSDDDIVGQKSPPMHRHTRGASEIPACKDKNTVYSDNEAEFDS